MHQEEETVGETRHWEPAPDFDQDLVEYWALDDWTQTWLRVLEENWRLYKDSRCVLERISNYFEDSGEKAYGNALRILVNTSDFHRVKTKPTLAVTVMKEFENWLQGAERVFCLSDKLQRATFRLLSKQKSMRLFKLVAKIYKLSEEKELLLDIILKMLGEKQYKEAAEYIIALELQDRFRNPETILLPLILLNKLSHVDNILKSCKEWQKPFVIYLDNIIAPGNNVKQILTDFIKEHKVPVAKHTLYSTQIVKLLARMIKLYNLPGCTLCPNMNKRQSIKGLQFLFHKRYVDGSLNTVNWREMVREVVGDEESLQLQTVTLLVMENDPQEALYFARAFNIPTSDWPLRIQLLDAEADRVDCGASTSKDEITKEDSINFHELNLSRDRIKLIATQDEFENFLDDELPKVDIVGIDSEWKPRFSATQKTELALIQIATHAHIYIVDVIALSGIDSQYWADLGSGLFENKNILKLGFGITHDMSVISENLPGLSKINTQGQDYLDIVHLWKRLVEEHNFIFPHEDEQQQKKNSLSKLVELCLGQRLDKSDQFSNWGKRPLRESQIVYAALDAYCLLEVFAAMKEQCKTMQIPFQDVCAKIQHIPLKSSKKKPLKKVQTADPSVTNADFAKPKPKDVQAAGDTWSELIGISYRPIASPLANKPQSRQQNQPFQRQPRPPPVPANKWRAICEPSLKQLAWELRNCGCDIILMKESENGGLAELFAQCDKEPNRVVLVRWRSFDAWAVYFTNPLGPRRSYYRVGPQMADKQLRVVLAHFNIVVKLEHVLSRCDCNSTLFAFVDRPSVNNYIASLVATDMDTDSKLFRYYKGLTPQQFVEPNDTLFREAVKSRTWTLRKHNLPLYKWRALNGTQIQLEKVPLNVLKNNSWFYVCEMCGRIHWDCPRWFRVVNVQLKDVIVREPEC